MKTIFTLIIIDIPTSKYLLNNTPTLFANAAFGQSLRIPVGSGNTIEPGFPVIGGYIRFNPNLNIVEYYNGTDWLALSDSSTGANFVPQTRTITINGVTQDLSVNRNFIIPGGVTTVFGRTGVITPAAGDYAAYYRPIDYVPSWEEIEGTPTIPAAQVNADWNASSGIAQILNKPAIPAAQVNADWSASSGITQILNKPTIPAAQVSADWNASSGVAQILNKPVIPAAQVSADWNASSGVTQVLNKPTIPAAQVSADWNASSGVTQILNKPAIPAAQVQVDWNASSGIAHILNKPTIPAAQVNADWNASSGIGQILNKPTLPTALSQFTNDLGNYGSWITGINSGMVTTALGYTPLSDSDSSASATANKLVKRDNDGNIFATNRVGFNGAGQFVGDEHQFLGMPSGGMGIRNDEGPVGFAAGDANVDVLLKTDGTLNYSNDVAASFTSRSLIDKGYADSNYLSRSLSPLYARKSASGDGSSTTISIMHNLGLEPSWFTATAISAAAGNISYVTADATYIYIHYSVAPPYGSGNLVYNMTYGNLHLNWWE